MMLFLADWVDKKWLTKFLTLWGLIQLGFGTSIYYFETIEEAAVFLAIGCLTLSMAFSGQNAWWAKVSMGMSLAWSPMV